MWNRTPSRAEGLVAAGATLAPTPAEAVAASELTILSLTDYQAMYAILGPVVEGAEPTGALAGKVIVNLSSDTPEASREAAAWGAKHGAGFVAGGVMVPAPAVGTSEAHVFYSGAWETFDRHEPILRLIGEPTYLGDDPGLAQLFYQAQHDGGAVDQEVMQVWAAESSHGHAVGVDRVDLAALPGVEHPDPRRRQWRCDLDSTLIAQRAVARNASS